MQPKTLVEDALLAQLAALGRASLENLWWARPGSTPPCGVLSPAGGCP